jgi:hypothetical protein
MGQGELLSSSSSSASSSGVRWLLCRFPTRHVVQVKAGSGLEVWLVSLLCVASHQPVPFCRSGAAQSKPKGQWGEMERVRGCVGRPRLPGSSPRAQGPKKVWAGNVWAAGDQH